MKALKSAVAAFALLSIMPLARADVVAEWNTIALDTATGSGKYRAYDESRVMAMVNIAMAETINFNEAKGPSRFLVTPSQPLSASSEAAAAAAAHTILVRLYPEQKAKLDAALERSLALESDQTRRESGRVMGASLGMNIYAILSSDSGSVTTENDATKPWRESRRSEGNLRRLK